MYVCGVASLHQVCKHTRHERGCLPWLLQDLMEAYFGQPHEAKMADAHPELAYQACLPFAPPAWHRPSAAAQCRTLSLARRRTPPPAGHLQMQRPRARQRSGRGRARSEH